MHLQSLVRPHNIEEALDFLDGDPELTPIVGGTDLMVQIRGHKRQDRNLIDLSGVLPREINVSDGHLKIGAATTMDAIARSEQVRNLYPALATAASLVGAWPIQCRATLGGNIANASPAADTAPPLLVAEAQLVLQSKNSRRLMPVGSFFEGPGKTAMEDGEIIVEILIDRQQLPVFSHFEKLGWRREQIISVISLALEFDIDASGCIRRPRVAFGAVAATPRRAPHTESSLEGIHLKSGEFEKALEAVQKDIDPIDDLRAPAWYRRMAGAVMLRRCLEGAAHA